MSLFSHSTELDIILQITDRIFEDHFVIILSLQGFRAFSNQKENVIRIGKLLIGTGCLFAYIKIN